MPGTLASTFCASDSSFPAALRSQGNHTLTDEVKEIQTGNLAKTGGTAIIKKHSMLFKSSPPLLTARSYVKGKIIFFLYPLTFRNWGLAIKMIKEK